MFYYDYMLFDKDSGDYFVKNARAEERDKMTLAEMRFVKRYLSLIMNSSIVSDSTKAYIRYNRIGSNRVIVKDIVNASKKSKYGKTLNENTVLAMLNYDQKKLQKYFDDDMLSKIRMSTYKDLNVYEEQLNIAIAKYGKSSELKEYLAIDIPVTEICGKLSDSDFDILLNIVKPYSKGVMKQLIEVIPDKMKGYLNFLLYIEEKSQLDSERYDKLKQLLTKGVGAEELKVWQDKFAAFDLNDISVEKEKVESPKVELLIADKEIEEDIDFECDDNESKADDQKAYGIKTNYLQF